MRFLLLMVLSAVLVCAGCSKAPSVGPDGGTDTDSDFLVPLSGVEILVVVDNSGGMSEESVILADALYSLVNTLMTPLDGSSHAAVDNIRVAITTTDMGLSWGGNPYEEGDGWPGAPPPCPASGDNGLFQTYVDETTWGDDIPCPSMTDSWAETSIENPNQNLADQAACLADQGTTGCGWEQQLQAAATAMDRTDQAGFFHDDSLLLVLVVSNDDECSLEDGPGMFATYEIQNPDNGLSMLNIACGRNPEYLYSIDHYADFYRARKNNADNAVAFASIVGVPVSDTCQGAGNEIDYCMDHPDMQFTEVIAQNSAGTDTYYWEPSCERGTVTTAWPGRRFVELAQTFGEFGYVFSLCNEDWTPAMNDIAEMIFTTIEESP